MLLDSGEPYTHIWAVQPRCVSERDGKNVSVRVQMGTSPYIHTEATVIF